MSNSRKALVTLALGDRYQRMFDSYCRATWQAYCDRHGYDLIVLDKSLDTSTRSLNRSPAWQKLLILSQDWADTYQQVVWADSDIMINSHNAPCIASIVPADKCGVINSYAIPSSVAYDKALARLYANWKQLNVAFVDNSTPAAYYTMRGLSGDHLHHVVHTGVIVCSPKHHRAVFEDVYYSYEDIHKTAEWNYEMPAFSLELLNRQLAHWIPVEYNWCVNEVISAYYPFVFHASPPSLMIRLIARVQRQLGIPPNQPRLSPLQIKCLINIYELGYFVHFAGCAGLMADLHPHLPDPAH